MLCSQAPQCAAQSTEQDHWGEAKGDFREPCHPPRVTSEGFYVHTSNQLLLEAFISGTLLRDWVQELISFKPQCSLGSAGTLGGVRRCQALCTDHTSNCTKAFER